MISARHPPPFVIVCLALSRRRVAEAPARSRLSSLRSHAENKLPSSAIPSARRLVADKAPPTLANFRSSLAGLPPPLRLEIPPGWDAPSSLGVGQPTVELRGGVSRGEFFGTDTAGDARINRNDYGRKQKKRGLFTSGMPCRVGGPKKLEASCTSPRSDT